MGTLLTEQALYMDCPWVTMFRNISDSILHWPVKIVTTDAEHFSQTLMTINQTWWCHKPNRCRDLLSIHTAIQITSLRIICT